MYLVLRYIIGYLEVIKKEKPKNESNEMHLP